MALTLYVNTYAEEADVERVMKQRAITATSTVTSTDLETFCHRRFEEINSVLQKAGYWVPVTQGITTLTIGTQLQANAAYVVDANIVQLKDSGGSLTGKVNRGDTLVFDGDGQVYVITDLELWAGSNLISVTITPGLRVAVTESQDVTYASTRNAKEILRNANALGAAADTLRTMAQSANSEPPASYEMIKEEYEAILRRLEEGDLPLIGVKKNKDVATAGTVRVGRRG